MSIAENQSQILLQLLAALKPHWRTDRALPERLSRLLAKDRRFGSRDRRLYRELVYTALRYLPWVEAQLVTTPQRAIETITWLAADTRDTRAFREAHGHAWPTCPPDLTERAHHLNASVDDLLPTWLRDECPNAFAAENLNALHRRAPLWIRLQTDSPDEVLADLQTHGWASEQSSLLPDALRLPNDAGVTACETYFAGQFEVQDLGSQMVLAAHAIHAGERWLDACAGAGGKTLQLARIVGPAGRVLATDIRANALTELTVRAKRAGLRNVNIATGNITEVFDGVLVDAPCSGTGTWRRSPHLKWTTTPGSVREHAALQRQILTANAQRVRAGGKLIYATCSLNRTENETVIAEFLKTHPDFRPIAPIRDFGFAPGSFGLTILPARHDTDGFFTCCLQRG